MPLISDLHLEMDELAFGNLTDVSARSLFFEPGLPPVMVGLVGNKPVEIELDSFRVNWIDPIDDAGRYGAILKGCRFQVAAEQLEGGNSRPLIGALLSYRKRLALCGRMDQQLVTVDIGTSADEDKNGIQYPGWTIVIDRPQGVKTVYVKPFIDP